MTREISNIAEHPIAGDVIEIREGSEEDTEVLLRVICVMEDYVGYKQYGKGRFWTHLHAWRKRIDSAAVRKIVRPGDQDIPF